MAKPAHSELTEEHGVPHGDAGGHGEVNPVQVDGLMALWTWVTFIVVALILYKFAWKPILAGLDNREETIRKSLDDAERITAKLSEIEQTQGAMIAEADETAKDIVAQSRKAAGEAARVIEDKARAESQILQENAQREIEAARAKAASDLQRESAELAVALTAKVLKGELDEKRQKSLTDQLIKEL